MRLSRWNPAWTLLALVATACAPGLSPDEARKAIESSPTFAKPRSFVFRTGVLEMDRESASDYEDLDEMGMIEIESIDLERRQLRVSLAERGREESGGWARFEEPKHPERLGWSVPVASRLLVEVEPLDTGDGTAEASFTWTWLPRDDQWEELADVEDDILVSFPAKAMFRLGESGWVLEEASLTTELDEAEARGMVGEASVPLLEAMLDADAAVDRATAAIALGRLGPLAAPAVPRLAEVMRGDEDVRVRFKAAGALWRLGEDAAPAVAALAEALEDEDIRVRVNAAGALRQLGPAAVDALPSLIRAAEKGSPIRLDAMNAIEVMGDPAEPAVAALVLALEDEDSTVRRAASDALWELGDTAVEAIPALARALEDEDTVVREHAAGALEEMGPYSAPAVEALIRAVADERSRVRATAISALGRIGTAASEAVPTIVAALDDPSTRVRLSAATVLGGALVTGRDAAVEQALTAALDDDEDTVRLAARRSLQALQRR